MPVGHCKRRDCRDLRERLALAEEKAQCPTCKGVLQTYRNKLNRIEERVRRLLAVDPSHLL